MRELLFRLKYWKPLHWCKFFEKHGWKIPKYLIGNPTYEDFTAPNYTETDPSGTITIATVKVTLVNAQYNQEAYVYKDFSANHFDALSVNYEVYINSTSTQYAKHIMGFSIYLDDVYKGGAANQTDLWVEVQKQNGGLNFALSRGNNWQGNDSYAGGYTDTLYYLTLIRAAGNDSVSLKIYSDAARTTLLDTLVVTGYSTTKWQYFYPFNTYYYAVTRPLNGYIQNVDLAAVLIKTVTVTETSRGRIKQLGITKTETLRGRIKQLGVSKTVQSRSRIFGTNTKQETSKGRVKKTITVYL